MSNLQLRIVSAVVLAAVALALTWLGGLPFRLLCAAISAAIFYEWARMQLRASVGVGLMWASPFGPIRIDYAIPVKKESTDDVQEFNFGIATRF